MKILQAILDRNGIAEPDGRPLHGYAVTAEEFARLGNFLRLMPDGFRNPPPNIAQAFVLWASEHIRQAYAGGILSWELVFTSLKHPYDRSLAVDLVEVGLHRWGRPLRRSEIGHREFLYSLLAEGGLPDLALAEAPKYRDALLGLIRRIEADGALAAFLTDELAMRAVMSLPQVLRTREQAWLLADLGQALVVLRRAIPEDLPPGSVESWMDAQQSDWRERLPLRLSSRSLEALILPALTQARGRPDHQEPLVRRELRWSGEQRGWVGIARIGEGSRLPRHALPLADPGVRLRLLTEDGSGLLAVPVESGWQLFRSGGRGTVDLLLEPERPVILSAHVDGRGVGNTLLDVGHPNPDEVPSLWRAIDPAIDQPEVIVPLSGRGRTRASIAFLLTGHSNVPLTCDDITVGEPMPGPGGRIWPLTGNGRVRVGEHEFSLTTAADTDAPAARLLVLGRTLGSLTLPDGTPVYLGNVQISGSEGDDLPHLLGNNLRRQPQKGFLGGEIIEWCDSGVVLARARIVSLPEGTKFTLRDCGAGRMRMNASGLNPGWHLRLTASTAEATGRVGSDGTLALELDSPVPQASITLRIVDPATTAAIELVGIWPAHLARIIDRSGSIITSNQQLSLKSLVGWRGLMPEGGGVIQFRLAGSGIAVAVTAQGVERLAAHADLIGQALSLAGADGRLHLRLVAQGLETNRLEIGRYDWTSEDAGPFRHLGPGETCLRAVLLEDPTQTAEIAVTGRIDLEGWLGTSFKGPWFIQGESERHGVMRPLVWQPGPPSHGSREARLEAYAREWTELLGKSADPGWTIGWQRIFAVRSAGTAAALDQVQALARVPAAAVALVMRVTRAERAAALALETEAPIWWPLVSGADWAQAMQMQKSYLQERLRIAGMAEDEIIGNVSQGLARIAGEVIMLRPELAGHIGLAMAMSGEPPVAFVAGGQMMPLAVPEPKARLLKLAQEAARRFDRLPDGSGNQQARRLAIEFGLNDHLLPLLHAPLVVAEVASGWREPPKPHEILQLLALRSIDPVWFDAALPAAMSLEPGSER